MFANPLNRYHLGDVVYIMPPNPTEIVNNFFELTGFNPDTVIESVVPTDAGKYRFANSPRIYHYRACSVTVVGYLNGAEHFYKHPRT